MFNFGYSSIFMIHFKDLFFRFSFLLGRVTDEIYSCSFKFGNTVNLSSLGELSWN